MGEQESKGLDWLCLLGSKGKIPFFNPKPWHRGTGSSGPDNPCPWQGIVCLMSPRFWSLLCCPRRFLFPVDHEQWRCWGLALGWVWLLVLGRKSQGRSSNPSPHPNLGETGEKAIEGERGTQTPSQGCPRRGAGLSPHPPLLSTLPATPEGDKSWAECL